LATYAIGDLQGCFAPLEQLLAAIRFDAARDRLWFVGDLVNRGPDSLACLRFVRKLGDSAVTVLGNHDLHLVCVAEGIHGTGKRDTLGDILRAPDRHELVRWLRHRPLMHVEGGWVLSHAGVLPAWTVDQARALAAEVEAGLRGPGYADVLRNMFGDEPNVWSETLAGWDRVRLIVNAFTRMRMCTPEGAMDLRFKGEPGDEPAGLTPWFDVATRRNRDHTLLFGHWSALGLLVRDDVVALDSGCVWGRSLSALRLEDRALFEVPCPKAGRAS
jgi:bis(5'-nucleosyl)-tetraphosphatase (symmetrical)